MASYVFTNTHELNKHMALILQLVIQYMRKLLEEELLSFRFLLYLFMITSWVVLYTHPLILLTYPLNF